MAKRALFVTAVQNQVTKRKTPAVPHLKRLATRATRLVISLVYLCQSSKKKIAKVREVPCPDDSDDSVSDEHVFVVGPHKHDKNVTAVISGVAIDMMIDSGASVNVIDSSAFRKLAQPGVTLQKSNIRMFTYCLRIARLHLWQYEDRLWQA